MDKVKLDLKGRHMLCTQDWKLEELVEAIELAERMQQHRYEEPYTSVLKHRTFFMFFYNPSVRTRQSFEAAATELGGHAQFLEPKSMRLKTAKTAGETVEDAAKVMSRYAAGLGIRILEDKVDHYGGGWELLKEYAEYASIPVMSMADDRFHPFQGLADVMGYRRHLGKNLKRKKLLMVWGSGQLVRSWCSVQENLLISSRFGMDVRLAHPKGYDLDPWVIEQTRANCAASGASFELTHDQEEAYDGDVEVVYSRNWMSPNAYAADGTLDKAAERKMAAQHSDWICNEERMSRTKDARYIHPMPIDRGSEVSDEVASGPRSICVDVAENRLHVQKAVMALTMKGVK